MLLCDAPLSPDCTLRVSDDPTQLRCTLALLSRRYLQNPHDEGDQKQTIKIKITICRILRNISLETATAERLCEREELDDVITSLLINADYATELFYEIVEFVSALISTLQSKGYNQNLKKLMLNLNDRNLFNILVSIHLPFPR